MGFSGGKDGNYIWVVIFPEPPLGSHKLFPRPLITQGEPGLKEQHWNESDSPGSAPEYRLIPFLNFRLVHVGDKCQLLWSNTTVLAPLRSEIRELLQFCYEKRQSK